MIILIALLVGHFLGDFWLQSRKMARDKSVKLKVLLLHGWDIYIMILAALWIVLPLSFPFRIMLLISAINAISHMIIDWFIWKGYKKCLPYRKIYNYRSQDEDFKYWEDKAFYTTMGLDQLLHGIIIVILYFKFLA